LQFEPENEAGRIFLGVVGASVTGRRLPSGRIERHALGGTPIGAPNDQHMITVAGSRSGKGRAVIIPNLIAYPGSVLAIDPKGDLARFTADWRADIMGHKVVVLDPFGEAGDVTARHGGGFNPLSFLKEGSPTLVEDAGLIADAMVIVSAETKDPHWDESAKMFLEGVILHVATWPAHADERHLVTVYRCLMERLDNLKNEMADNFAQDGAITAAATHFFGMGDNERASVLSSLRRHIRFLGYGLLQSVLKTDSFALGDLKTEKLTVYLSLPAMRMGTCARWLRLFVNLTLAALGEEKCQPAYPVLMCLDEFATLGTMKALEDAAGQIAGLGCKLWPIVQDLGQLHALYNTRWETFLGNAGVLQFFGNSDMRTLEWISKRLGDTTIHTMNKNEPTRDDQGKGATGTSYGQHVHRLMTPEEISRFFGRDDEFLRQLIIRPTWSPMVLQRAFYDRHERFQDYRNYSRQSDDTA
jgi:type IV secretion system protein VirD4